jgi:hypothetical protein
MDWAAFQACLHDGLPGSPAVNDEKVFHKCIEELTIAIQEATAASGHKRDPLLDSRPLLLAGMDDETPEGPVEEAMISHERLRLDSQGQLQKSETCRPSR